jgi:hypothetical protein
VILISTKPKGPSSLSGSQEIPDDSGAANPNRGISGLSPSCLERLGQSLAVDAEKVIAEFRAVDLLRPQEFPLGRAVLSLQKSLAIYKQETGQAEGWPG